MSKHSQDDQENDESRNPTPELVRVNDLVAEKGDEHSADGNNDNTNSTRHIRVDSDDQLSADNRVCGGPADTSEHVEGGDCLSLYQYNVKSSSEKVGHTEFDTPPTEPETGNHHLAQAEFSTENREEADSQDTEQVEEQYGQNTVDETAVKDRLSEHSDCKGCDDHVGGEPLEKSQYVTALCYFNTTHHASHVQIRGVCSLIFRHSLDTSLFDVELSGETLHSGVPGIAIFEGLPGDGAGIILIVPVDGMFLNIRGQIASGHFVVYMFVFKATRLDRPCEDECVTTEAHRPRRTGIDDDQLNDTRKKSEDGRSGKDEQILYINGRVACADLNNFFSACQYPFPRLSRVEPASGRWYSTSRRKDRTIISYDSPLSTNQRWEMARPGLEMGHRSRGL